MAWVSFPRLAGVLCAAMLAACSTIPADRMYWSKRADRESCEIRSHAGSAGATIFEKGCGHGTPERWSEGPDERFRLHFVELDDQGWLREHSARKETPGDAPAITQIDAALKDLATTLEAGRKVRLVIFVHGWKHSADPQDRDVVRVRELLAQLAATRDALTKEASDVVGIYIGWRGRSWETDNSAQRLLLNLTFWTRKSTAIRVAQGEVREVFARVRKLQEFHNRPQRCGADSNGRLDCLRTFVIGHSFGAWITYAALSQSLFESFSTGRDTPESGTALPEAIPRPFDTVLLVNPAFEAVRYAPVHAAAVAAARAHGPRVEPPLLVSLTSTADPATAKFFPLGRRFNILFEQADDAQKEAMLNTHGHMDRYLTHRLVPLAGLDETAKKDVALARCEGWSEIGEEGSEDDRGKHYLLKEAYRGDIEKLKRQVRTNAIAEALASREYLAKSDPGVPRHLCGDLVLMRAAAADSYRIPVGLPLWNVRTSEAVIPNHSDFMTPAFFNFVKMLYADQSAPVQK